MNHLAKHFKQSDSNILFGFLLLLLAMVALHPLIYIGQTTHDDTDIALNYGYSVSLFEISYAHANNQGRLPFFWGYPLLRVPYFVDSQIWYVLARLAGIAILLASIFYSTKRLFSTSWVGLAAIAFYLAFVKNGWDHNALTSYPFAFNMYAAFFLMSLGIFAKAIDQNNLWLAVVAGLLYFFSMGIELFVLFSPFYWVVLVSRDRSGNSLIERTISGKWYIASIALPLAAFLLSYYFWRLAHPSNYDGNVISTFDFPQVLNVVWTYSLSAFPLDALKSLKAIDTHTLFELSLSHLIKPVVVAFIMYRLLVSTKDITTSIRTLAFGAAISFIGIFLPNILLGLTQKHQEWVQLGTHSYLYTYYSFVSATVFSSLSLAVISNRLQLLGKWIWIALSTLFILTAAIVSFSVEIANQRIALDQKLSHRKWQLIREIISSPEFNEIPFGATIVAPTLTSHIRGTASASAADWTVYLKLKTGKNLKVVNDKCDVNIACYSLTFRQTSKSDNQFAILANVINHDPLKSNSMTIYSMPKLQSTVIFGSFKGNRRSNPTLRMNGLLIQNVGSETFSFNLPTDFETAKTQRGNLTSNVHLDPNEISVSYYNINPQSRSSSVKLGDGFYDWESAPGLPNWAWAKDESELTVTNLLETPQIITVAFEAQAIEPLSVHPTINGISYPKTALAVDRYTSVSFDLNVEPGITRILLSPDRHAKPPTNGDTRLLSFAIRDLRVFPKSN